MSSVHPDAIKHQVRHHLDKLRQLSYHELVALPEWTTATINFGSANGELITYRRGQAGDELLIMVQCLPPGSERGVFWFGVQADGFRMTTDGEVVSASDRERFDFM